LTSSGVTGKIIDMSNTVKQQYIISLADGKVVSNVEWNFLDEYPIIEYSENMRGAYLFTSYDVATDVMDHMLANGEEPFVATLPGKRYIGFLLNPT
jgi:hypothetical protein